MPVILWISAAAVLALTWRIPDTRLAVVPSLALYAIIAVVCGIGGVGLTLVDPGLRRKRAVVLILVLSWAIAAGFHQHRESEASAKWRQFSISLHLESDSTRD